MAWDRNEARTRIQKSYKDSEKLTLTELTREVDLRNLPRHDCRIVKGVHLYVDPVNLAEELKAAKEDAAKLRKLLRHLHIYQRQLSWLLMDVDGGQRVHFQGGRLHAVFYKPYDTTNVANPEAQRLSAAMQYVSQARELATLVGDQTGIHFELEAGVDCGETIATVNGEHGASELLFIGDPANKAAKILTGKAGTRLSENAKRLEPDTDDPEPLAEKYAKQVKDDVEAHPLDTFVTFEPETAIDYDGLGVRTADLKDGVSFFGDISGFTNHVASLATASDKIEALRGFHAARSEMHHVVVRDYDGDFIQFQGDRVQGLFYESRATRRFSEKAVESAAAIKEAIDICGEELQGFEALGITVGVATGRVYVTKVGVKGDREVVVLGASAQRASVLQDDCLPGQAAINERLYDSLKEKTQKQFKASGEDRYEGELSLEKLRAEEDAKNFRGRVEVATTTPGVFRVTSAPPNKGIQPAKSYLAR